MRFVSKGAPIALAAIALSALAATTASATETNPEWAVKKAGVFSTLKAGESEGITEKLTTKHNFVLKVRNGGLTLECSGVTLDAAKIEGPKTGGGAYLGLTGCKFTAPTADTKCGVASSGEPNGTIRTVPVATTLEGTTKTPKIRVTPQSGKEFSRIVITEKAGEKCTAEGVYFLRGVMVGNLDNSEAHKEHVISFTETSGSELEFFESSTVFTGEGSIALTSGNEYGAL